MSERENPCLHIDLAAPLPEDLSRGMSNAVALIRGNRLEMITMLSLLANVVAQRTGKDYRNMLQVMAAAGPISGISMSVDLAKIKEGGGQREV